MRLLLMCCVLLCQLDSLLSARILAVLPMPSRSHFAVSSGILYALAERGHEVTVYSPYPPKQPVKNFKHVEIHTEFEKTMQSSLSFEIFNQILRGSSSYWGLTGAQTLWQVNYPICEETLLHPKVKELLKSGQKFDLFVSEALFGHESLLALGYLFNAATININTFVPWSVVNRIHGNDMQIAYQAEAESLDFTDQMSFLERFRNLVSVLGTLLQYNFLHLPHHQAILDRAFGDGKLPPVENMVANLSLTLANMHPTIGSPRALPPTIVPVGGLHLLETPPPLPNDIKEFMDSGKNAVIYFSLGSVVPVHLLPEHYIKAFVSTFSKLPYKVLWKIEADSVPNLPKNIMISKWVPQQSVLAHPNCVLFITHGGLLSQQEAFFFGVPVVGIPFFGDQPYNVRQYEHHGVGVGLDFTSLTEQSFTKAITSVVGKPRYIENAKHMSTLFRHRVMSPIDSAVFWVEYVLRHNSATHLRPHAASMPLYQLALLDILAVLLVVVVATWLLLKFLLTFVCCRRKQAVVVESKKKKN